MEAHEEIGQSNPSSAWWSSRSAFVVLIKGGLGEMGGVVLVGWGRGGTRCSAPQVQRCVIVATAAFLRDISAPDIVDQAWYAAH